MTVFANRNYLSTFAVSKARSRHDYDSPDHLLADMMHDEYWQTVMDLLEPKDLIHVSDAAGDSAELRIDWKNGPRRTVGFSILREIEEKPVMPASGLTLKYRGPRGGLWCIIDATGAIVRRDLRNEAEAHRHLEDMLRDGKAAA